VDLSFQELDIFGKTIVRQKYTLLRDIGIVSRKLKADMKMWQIYLHKEIGGSE